MDCLKLVVSACSPGSTDWKLHNRPHKSPCCLEITLLGLATKLHALHTYFHTFRPEDSQEKSVHAGFDIWGEPQSALSASGSARGANLELPLPNRSCCE